MESAPIECIFPRPGWVEQDANAIWRAQLDAARRVLTAARVESGAIAALGITNQRETTIVWDRKTGQPVAPAIVWQCRRTAGFCSELAATPAAAAITRKTGLVIDAYFSGSKVRWILEERAGRAGAGAGWRVAVRHRRHLAGLETDERRRARNRSIERVANHADGHRDGRVGSRVAATCLGFREAMLPRIAPSSSVVGTAAAEHLGAEIPIAGIAGDQQAALFGQACFRAGLSKNTYGTGCFALLHTGARQPVSKHKLLATRAASTSREAQFAIEGSIFIAGAAVQWLRDKLGIIASAAETRAIAESVPHAGGVHFVPAFVGLGSPHWDPEARGMICGMTLATGRAEIVRAALEAHRIPDAGVGRSHGGR